MTAVDEPTVISAGALPADTLEAVLAKIGRDQIVNVRFEEELGFWTAGAWASVGHEQTMFGTGSTLAAALADLHEPQFLKRARDVGPVFDWTTEEPAE